jgi:thiamine pyrophosphokinase
MTKKAWLFTATSPTEVFSSYSSIDLSKDMIIAVDKGLERLNKMRIMPHLIIGDMDSVAEGLLDFYKGTLQFSYPTDKDETDTELALSKCLEFGMEDIIICNGLEGRFDHSLALLQNLLLLKDAGVQARVESEHQRVWVLGSETEIRGSEGCILSLIAWGGEAVFAESEGLQYALKGLKLPANLSRGISNRVLSTPARIVLESGIVFCILTKSI